MKSLHQSVVWMAAWMLLCALALSLLVAVDSSIFLAEAKPILAPIRSNHGSSSQPHHIHRRQWDEEDDVAEWVEEIKEEAAEEGVAGDDTLEAGQEVAQDAVEEANAAIEEPPSNELPTSVNEEDIPAVEKPMDLPLEQAPPVDLPVVEETVAEELPSDISETVESIPEPTVENVQDGTQQVQQAIAMPLEDGQVEVTQDSIFGDVVPGNEESAAPPVPNDAVPSVVEEAPIIDTVSAQAEELPVQDVPVSTEDIPQDISAPAQVEPALPVSDVVNDDAPTFSDIDAENSIPTEDSPIATATEGIFALTEEGVLEDVPTLTPDSTLEEWIVETTAVNDAILPTATSSWWTPTEPTSVVDDLGELTVTSSFWMPTPTENAVSILPEATEGVLSILPEATEEVASILPVPTEDVASILPEPTEDLVILPEPTEDVVSILPEPTEDVASILPVPTEDVASILPVPTEDVSILPEPTEDVVSILPEPTEDVASILPEPTPILSGVVSILPEPTEDIASILPEPTPILSGVVSILPEPTGTADEGNTDDWVEKPLPINGQDDEEERWVPAVDDLDGEETTATESEPTESIIVTLPSPTDMEEMTITLTLADGQWPTSTTDQDKMMEERAVSSAMEASDSLESDLGGAYSPSTVLGVLAVATVVMVVAVFALTRSGRQMRGWAQKKVLISDPESQGYQQRPPQNVEELEMEHGVWN